MTRSRSASSGIAHSACTHDGLAFELVSVAATAMAALQRLCISANGVTSDLCASMLIAGGVNCKLAARTCVDSIFSILVLKRLSSSFTESFLPCKPPSSV
jgi:hypothetical protein